ncbi:hypothetical protein GGX14DRAFT_472371 [Mycena pura]|uniref:Chromo domain-containing protein n=1 Tax=Mycena pura TaxID=153505 RepID=A0AAD6V480_9AGAR|nr:hypothetical protein GGX14DRAFT_472371 [Mycena pura]
MAQEARDAVQAAYTLAMPSPIRKTASRSAVAAENDELRRLLNAAGVELDKNYAQMMLMNRENEMMRQQLHAKKNKTKCTYTTGKARLMTSAEMMQALLDELHKKQMGELHSELRKNVFPELKKKSSDAQKAERAARAAEKAAEKEAEKARKAAAKEAAKVEREARKAAKAAEKALARGRGRARGARGRGRGRDTGGRGRGRGSETRDSADEDSSAQSDSSSDESQLDDAVVDADAGAVGIESSDDEDAHGDPFVAVDGPPSAASAPPAVEDESDDESAGGETEIASFNGHRWESRRHLEFQVIWMDGDITWERLSNVNDCAAMDQYLAHHDLDDPLLLSRRKFLLNNKIQAINE